MQDKPKKLTLGQRRRRQEIGARVVCSTRYVAMCVLCDWSSLDTADVKVANAYMDEHMAQRHREAPSVD